MASKTLVARKPVQLGTGLSRVNKKWAALLQNHEQNFLTDNQLSMFVDKVRPGCERIHFYPLPFPHEFKTDKYDVWELTKHDSLRSQGPVLEIEPQETRLEFLPHMIRKEMRLSKGKIVERAAVSNNTAIFEWAIAGLREATLSFSLPHFKAEIEKINNGILVSVKNQVFVTLALAGVSDLAVTVSEGDTFECKLHFNLLRGRKIYLALTCDYSRKKALSSAASALKKPEGVFQGAKRTWDDYFTRVVPYFACSDKNLEKLFYYQAWVTRANWYDIPYEPFTHPYTCPWKTGAFWQWSWNTPVAAIQERWFNDKTVGESGILLEGTTGGGLNIGTYLHPTVRQTEFRRHNDQMSAIVKYKKEGRPANFKLESFSTMAHTTPNGLLGAWEFYLASGDKAWLKKAVQVMIEAEAAFSSHDIGNGLCTCMFVDDFDYSLRWKPFSSNYKPVSYDWELDTPVIAIDYNCYLHCLRERLIEAAREAGVQIDADALRRNNVRLKTAIQEFLWDEESGFFYDADPRTMKRSDIKSIAAFSALYTRIADERQAGRLVEHLTNPGEFATPYPCPSLSLDSPAEDPTDFRIGGGSLTTTGTWFTVEGLMRYGYKDLAIDYVLKTIRMMTKGGKITAADWYHTTTGASLRTHNELTQQGLIVADLICRYLIGIHPRPGKTFEINPLALEKSRLKQFIFGPYRFCDKMLTVKWDRKKGYHVLIEDKK